MTEASIAHVQKVVAEKGTDAWWQLPLEGLLPAELRDQAARLKKGEDTMVSINLSFSDQDPHGYWRLLHGYCWRSCGRRSCRTWHYGPRALGGKIALRLLTLAHIAGCTARNHPYCGLRVSWHVYGKCSIGRGDRKAASQPVSQPVASPPLLNSLLRLGGTFTFGEPTFLENPAPSPAGRVVRRRRQLGGWCGRGSGAAAQLPHVMAIVLTCHTCLIDVLVIHAGRVVRQRYQLGGLRRCRPGAEPPSGPVPGGL